jgi:general secretion pathway protein H
MSRSSADAGFTLVEVLVVLMILGLATTAAVPLLRKPPAPVRLKADVTRMAAALRVTRAVAMAQNRAMDFVIQAGPATYASPAVPATVIDPAITLTMATAPPRRGAATGLIRFFPSGQSTGGDVRLRLDQAEMRLQVIWATGHVLVSP